MAKTRTIFVCQQCGAQQTRWMGKCPDCGTWDSLVEQVESRQSTGKSKESSVVGARPTRLRDVPTGGFQRLPVLGEELSRVLGGGLVPGSVVLIGGDPGVGKCLTADSRVLDPDTGALRPITAWADRPYPVLALHPASGRLAPHNGVRFLNQGIRPIVEVMTCLGRRLRCTPSHPVLTPDGWRAVGELTPGTRIATPRSLPFFGSQAMPQAAVKLIAYILSDGTTQAETSVTTAIPEVVADDELRRLAEAVNKPISDLLPIARERAATCTPVDQLLEHVGVRYSRAADKSVPETIFCLPRLQVALFLRTLFTYDGSLFVNRDGAAGISYSTISRRLAEDVQHLLLRFGFVARLRTKHQIVRGEPYIAYELQLLGVSETRRFLDEIGIIGRAEAKDRLAQLATPKLDSTQFDTIPTGPHFWAQLQAIAGSSYRKISVRAGVTIRNRRHDRPLCRQTVVALADAYPTPWLQNLAYGPIYWDEIATITPAGEEPVFDLSVPGSANFVANDLIVHNSTLLSQVAGHFAANVGPALYVSAEESAQQIKLRAERLGLPGDELFVYSENNLETILAQIRETKPGMVIIDSIQTVYLEELTSAAGSVSQVREGALRLMQLAKELHIPVFLVGHVTKEGAIAGPRVLEHIVDVVLYLEGDRFHQYRLLRGVKNRFGSTNEVGVFEMAGDGMREVSNPSLVFLAERNAGTPGSTVAVMMEGTRPLLVEVQALTSNTGSAQPRRSTNGFDPNRLLMLVAVLTKRVGLPLFNQDIYVNIVGGLRISEPAADLAVAVAIASSYRNLRIDPELVLLGEVGLSGELRSVSQIDRRLSEAAKLGFTRAAVPASAQVGTIGGLQTFAGRSLVEVVDLLANQ